MFKAGDKVRKKDGSNFSDGTEVAEVVGVIGSIVVLDKMSWIKKAELKKAEEKSLEDTAYELGTKSTDNINPDHYKTGGIETFDYMKAKLTTHELDGYLKGNIIKYVSRERLKNGTEDLKKAQWYLDKLVEIRAED